MKIISVYRKVPTMMLPEMSVKREADDILTFTINNTNVSVVNAIRRTILSDVPSVVFHTFPYSENKCTVHANTTRFNNEIIKHRLSLVPIHITDLTIPLDNYLLEVKKKNTSEVIEYITTEDFQIKDIKTDKYLSKGDRDKIFPKNGLTNYYIEFLRLRPKLGSNLDGEELHLTAKFSISTAKSNGAYNQASTCFYKNTVNPVAANDVWVKKAKQLKSEGMDETQIAFEKKNWELLDGQRIYIPDSFDFVLKSVGIYENKELVQQACDILNEHMAIIQQGLDVDDVNVVSIQKTTSTIENCYDIILKNYDYTVGKVLEYYMYTLHFEGDAMLSFCGFHKEHPHDDFSVLRIAFKNASEPIVVKQFLRDAITASGSVITHMRTLF
jgi:DNA-directed RNA polymerase subunit L